MESALHGPGASVFGRPSVAQRRNLLLVLRLVSGSPSFSGSLFGRTFSRGESSGFWASQGFSLALQTDGKVAALALGMLSFPPPLRLDNCPAQNAVPRVVPPRYGRVLEDTLIWTYPTCFKDFGYLVRGGGESLQVGPRPTTGRLSADKFPHQKAAGGRHCRSALLLSGVRF
jgi:hypothetical protein